MRWLDRISGACASISVGCRFASVDDVLHVELLHGLDYRLDICKMEAWKGRVRGRKGERYLRECHILTHQRPHVLSHR